MGHSPDADDLSHITQQPEESARKFWHKFLTKKNQIIDCPDAEALAASKHNVQDEWLAKHLGQEKPRTMAALTCLMTHFCAGEDNWLARSNNITKSPGNSDTKDNSDELSNLNKILDKICQIHSTPGKPKTIPTEIVGSSNSPADLTPNTSGSTHQARTMTNPTSRAPENKRISHKRSKQ